MPKSKTLPVARQSEPAGARLRAKTGPAATLYAAL